MVTATPEPAGAPGTAGQQAGHELAPSDFARLPVFAAALALAALLVVFADRYGYHRDELLPTPAIGLGYPDQPPLIRCSPGSCPTGLRFLLVLRLAAAALPPGDSDRPDRA
jgi:hypothetical protein